MKLTDKEQEIFEMYVFRKNMGMSLTLDKAEQIWGDVAHDFDSKFPGILDDCTSENKTSLNKIAYLKKNINNLLISGWVRSIYVTGSIAAGFCSENDDIDVFIVVDNGIAWIYRLLMRLKNINNKFLRNARSYDVKDKICPNYIAEVDHHYDLLNHKNINIFEKHELSFMISVYNSPSEVKKPNLLLKLLNSLAYGLQLTFMIISFHKPEISRIVNNYKKGKIAFYPSKFKDEKIRSFKKLFDKELEVFIKDYSNR